MKTTCIGFKNPFQHSLIITLTATVASTMTITAALDTIVVVVNELVTATFFESAASFFIAALVFEMTLDQLHLSPVSGKTFVSKVRMHVTSLNLKVLSQQQWFKSFTYKFETLGQLFGVLFTILLAQIQTYSNSVVFNGALTRVRTCNKGNDKNGRSVPVPIWTDRPGWEASST